MEKITTLFSPGSEGLLTPLREFFDDTAVSEILINRPGEVFIDRHGVMERHVIPVLDVKLLRYLFTFIANENGQCLSEDSPILSGSLTDGSRVQLVMPPAAKHHALSVRRASHIKRSLADYAASGFYDECRAFDLYDLTENLMSEQELELIELHRRGLWDEFIRLAILCKKNIVISGATFSGKTTYLKACTSHIPHDERIITLEDTYEVEIPHQNVVNLLAPKKIEGQKATLSMQDLVQCALRLRPDRLIMGEIRGREVLDFVSACSTGHEGTITSIHANNPRMAFMRMIQLYKQNNVPSMRDEDIERELHSVIDIIVQVNRTDRGRLASLMYYKEASRKDAARHNREQDNRMQSSIH